VLRSRRASRTDAYVSVERGHGGLSCLGHAAIEEADVRQDRPADDATESSDRQCGIEPGETQPDDTGLCRRLVPRPVADLDEVRPARRQSRREPTRGSRVLTEPLRLTGL